MQRENFILSHYPVPEQVVAGLGEHIDGGFGKIVVSNLVADGIWAVFRQFLRLKVVSQGWWKIGASS